MGGFHIEFKKLFQIEDSVEESSVQTDKRDDFFISFKDTSVSI